MLETGTFRREIRSGSSLPLIVDSDDGRRYLMKARGSGVFKSQVARLRS